MPVVLVILTSIFNLLLLTYLDKRQTVFGNGIALLSDETNTNGSKETALGGLFSPDDPSGYNDNDPISQITNFVFVDSAYLLNINNPLSNVLPTREGLLIYKVQKGDSLSRIAANFGISLNTVLWANKNLKGEILKPGQEIVILPINGVLHQVQFGETLDSIASQYSVDVNKIIAFNIGLSPAKLESRSTIVIPGAKPLESSGFIPTTKLPNLSGYFAIPTTGWNWGRLHNYNAVDIANICGTPVYASAEGLVIERAVDGWNGGYGKNLILEHSNNTKTRYAHMEKIAVSVGDYILKGDLVGYIGNTGSSHGPTGCHLHFEVIGAKNPFAK